jgi:hypothetical protein
MKKIIAHIIFLFLFYRAYSQPESFLDTTDTLMGIIDSSTATSYPFIKFSENRYIFYSQPANAWIRLHGKMDSLINYRKSQVVIYHIGGSHIQADHYTNKVRTHLNTYWPNLNGPKGIIFPYTVAGTNNPWSYISEHTGKWQAHKNVDRKDTTKLGLLGIAVSTNDSLASIKMYYRKSEERKPKFHKVKVYHNIGYHNYNLFWSDSTNVKQIYHDALTGYTEFILKNETDTFCILAIRKNTDTSSRFIFYGTELLSNEPGVIYNSIGVNGASFTSYLKCVDFEKQLAVLKPDLFIISIGTNDANVPYDDFRPEIYKANYEALIKRILNANPNAAILLTVPNDAYYYRRYPNKNIPRVRDVIIELATQYGFAVWDFFSIMGGLGSSQNWYKNNLMIKDRIHFTYQGYLLKGDLFFEAFLKYMDEFEYRKIAEKNNKN